MPLSPLPLLALNIHLTVKKMQLTSAMEDKLRAYLDVAPAQEAAHIVDFQTLYTWYKDEFDQVSLCMKGPSPLFQTQNSFHSPHTSPDSTMRHRASSPLQASSPRRDGSAVSSGSSVVTGHPYWGGQRNERDSGAPNVFMF
jgi:hypothetical protein